MAKKLGTLIKEARTSAGLTQGQLAKKVNGMTASDVSNALNTLLGGALGALTGKKEG